MVGRKIEVTENWKLLYKSPSFGYSSQDYKYRVCWKHANAVVFNLNFYIFIYFSFFSSSGKVIENIGCQKMTVVELPRYDSYHVNGLMARS